MAKKVSFSLASVREGVRLGYIHVVARPNLFKNVVLWGCVRLLGSISYTSSQRSSQMNVEAANDVDPKY